MKPQLAKLPFKQFQNKPIIRIEGNQSKQISPVLQPVSPSEPVYWFGHSLKLPSRLVSRKSKGLISMGFLMQASICSIPLKDGTLLPAGKATARNFSVCNIRGPVQILYERCDCVL